MSVLQPVTVKSSSLSDLNKRLKSYSINAAVSVLGGHSSELVVFMRLSEWETAGTLKVTQF